MLNHLTASARTGRNVRLVLSNSAAIALAMALAMPVHAQVLEEIVVTAQKREQNIQDVSIAVAAFSGEQMRILGINNSHDITAWVPNVNVSGNLAGQNTQFSIRGVTQNDFNDIIESPVAVYLDEGYIPIAQANTFAVYDIKRVEIMKGPQSTLFGRNATGGVVQYISNKPSFDEVEAYADVEYGQYDSPNDANRFRLQAAIGGPFSDNAAGRIAVMYTDDEPYLENLYRTNPASSAAGQPERFGVGTFGGDNSLSANRPAPDAGADLGGSETTALRGILSINNPESLFTMATSPASTRRLPTFRSDSWEGCCRRANC
jgi:iron complex outermembrane receptor protein